MPDWHLEAIPPQDLDKIIIIAFIESRVFSCWVEGPITIQVPAKMRW
jgi:hypothetical protein